jgi:RNA polymerase sigma-70 factor (ECF subfamily)
MMFFVPREAPRAAQTAAGAAALVRRLQAGDSVALEELYRCEAGPVYRYVLALAGNAAWAADATQEAFVALATRPEGYDPDRGALGAYLAGIARNALAAHWRELRRLEPLEAEEATEAMTGEQAADEQLTPEAALAQSQDVQALWRALRALPAPFREAVVLVDLQERGYAEAAQIAGVEVNTLRTRLHRGRARLATALSTPAPAPEGEGR